MSTFNGKPSEIPWLSIDRFDGDNLTSTCFLLSHCHTDHMEGIRHERFISRLRDHPPIFLYCSDITAAILRHSGLSSIMHKVSILPIEGSSIIRIPTPKDETSLTHETEISITMIPAGHCPGSVMFLMEGDCGNVLYTGDFRLAAGDVRKLNALHNGDGGVKPITSMYLDTTFIGMPGQKTSAFPSRAESAAEVCRLIREWLDKGEEYVVNLHTSARYGSEYLFLRIAGEFNMKVHVHGSLYRVYKEIPDIEYAVTTDPYTRIHACFTSVCGKSCVNDRRLKIRNIKPSALWWYCSKTQLSDMSVTSGASGDRCRVVYSCHASHDEIKAMVTYLKPERIEPCVVPDLMTRPQVVETCKELQRVYQPAPKNVPSRSVAVVPLKGAGPACDSASSSDESPIPSPPAKRRRPVSLLVMNNYADESMIKLNMAISELILTTI